MQQGWRVVVASAVALVAVGAMVACGDGDDPAGAPVSTAATGSVTAAPTSSAVPAPVDVPPPPAARVHSDAGAQAFVRYYFGRLDSAFLDPTHQAMTTRHLTTCKSCRNLEVAVLRLRQDHEHATARPYFVLDLEQPIQSTSAATVFEFTLVHAVTRVADVTGRVVKTDPREVVLVDFGVAWRSSQWMVSGIREVPVRVDK